MARNPDRQPPRGWTPFEVAGHALLRSMRPFYAPNYPKLAGKTDTAVVSLQDISTFRERPSLTVIEKLFDFREKQPRRSPLSDEHLAIIQSTLANARPPERRSIYASYNFIAALGIDITASEKSVEKYRGSYLHFNLNDENQLVTASCLLSTRLGSDDAPIYRAWRVIKSDGYRRLWKFEGTYFTNEHHLFIVGSRRKKVDARLSILHVDYDDEQSIVRGMHLAVSSYGTVLASRCVLAKWDLFDRMTRRQLLHEPRKLDDLANHSCPALDEITTFLHGRDEPSYIKNALGT